MNTSEPGFVLAPMDGMTHAAFRLICFEYGADGATTEMILSLAYGRSKRRQSDAFLETLTRLPGEGNLAAQLIGSDPGMMAASARKLTALRRFDAIDINMGCPARKVVGSGNGSALLKNVPLATAVMAAVKENTDLPVRLKLRLGWDAETVTAPELALAARDMGFEAITLHGRTRAQMYRGEVDIGAIRRVCAQTGMRVYANGGVTCAADALSFLEATGAAGVAIGRVALKQPWIFDDIRRLRRGEAVPPRGAEERVRLLTRLAALTCLHRPERVAIGEMRKFSAWIAAGLTGSDEMLPALNGIWTLDGYRGLMEDWLDWLIRIGDTAWHDEYLPDMTLDTVRVPERNA